MSVKSNIGVVTDGLVFAVDAANYESYPGSGTTWTDLAGNNNGTLKNGPTFDSGNGGSIVFDGTNDRVNLSTSTSLPGDFTALAITKIPSLTPSSNWAMFFGAADTDNFIAVTNDFATLRVQSNNSTNSDLNSISYPSNEIVMLQVTQEGNSNYWWINNTYLGTSSNGSYDGMEITRLVSYADGNNLGMWAGNYYYASLYNRALTSSEILQNYNALKNRFV
jgi:hypothetical protein